MTEHEQPNAETPDVWTPGNVTHGEDHTTRDGKSREATS